MRAEEVPPVLAVDFFFIVQAFVSVHEVAIPETMIFWICISLFATPKKSQTSVLPVGVKRAEQAEYVGKSGCRTN